LPGLIWRSANNFLKKTHGAIETTLVSDRDYFTYTQPQFGYQQADATRADVSVPLKDLSEKHGFDLIVDGVVKFEAKEKRVTLKSWKSFR